MRTKNRRGRSGVGLGNETVETSHFELDKPYPEGWGTFREVVPLNPVAWDAYKN